MQEHAAPKEPALEREDWMSKAMPKSIPGVASETADKAKEEPAKKVTLLSLKAFISAWHRKVNFYRREFTERSTAAALRRGSVTWM